MILLPVFLIFIEKNIYTSYVLKEKYDCYSVVVSRYINVTVHMLLSREVFWHEYAKIPRHTSQNSIAAGNLE